MPDPAITSLLSQILNPVILGSFLQGAYTTLFIYTVFLFVTGDRHKRTWTDVALFGVIVTLYLSSLLYLTANWASIDQAFVKNGDSSDSIIGWLVGSGLFYSVFPETFRLLSILLADSVMIWRCSVIWHRRLIVVLPLSLMAATNFVVMVFELKSLAGSPISSHFGTPAAGTTIFGLSLAVTVLSTILIIARIIYIGTLKSVARYWNILEMVIESSALYCVSILVLLPFWVLPTSNPASFALTFVQEINQGMLGIAPTLLYARVLAGGARPDSSWIPSRASRSTAIDFNSISHVHFQSHSSRTFDSSHRSQTLGKDSEVGIHSGTYYKDASIHI